MKVLLIKDVYKLGRAGDVKRVADGYGRNYLIPQNLAVLATPSALKQAEHIRARENVKRATLNKEMGGVAEILSELTLSFSAKAGETGKLYGSITPQMIADMIKEKSGVEVSRRQMDFEPIRTLGTHKVNVRLTMDLIPELTVVVYREGEALTQIEEEVEAETGAEVQLAEEAESALQTEEAESALGPTEELSDAARDDATSDDLASETEVAE